VASRGQDSTQPPPLRHEGMRVREGVRPRQTAPRASDATQSGCLRNDTRRVPACPRDVGAGEHPHLATDCIHTRALALGARAGKSSDRGPPSGLTALLSHATPRPRASDPVGPLLDKSPNTRQPGRLTLEKRESW